MKNNDTGQTTKVIPKSENKRRVSPDSGAEKTDTRETKELKRELGSNLERYRRGEMTADEYWERIFYVHLKTKELYILAEEYGSELKTFYLPVNSLKDAYENIIHVCANDYMVRCGGSQDNPRYVLDNLRSALKHECKAFFDTADFLSIIIRKKLSDCLNGFSYPQIASVWDEYGTVRQELIQTNREIAEIRTRKSETDDYYIDEDVEKYYVETKKLLERYIYVEEHVYPKLEQRFNDI